MCGKIKRTIDYSYTLSFTTQLFNSYTSYFDPVIKQTKREWAGSILNPATFENGFGLGLSFGKKSMLNVSLATVRLRTEPIIRSQSTTNKNVIGNLPRGKLIFDYGVSTQALTSNELTEKLAMNSTAKFFIKGFQREYFELDVSNKINYTIWKCFQLRADVKLVYDPLVSLKMQYRNELLFGVFYDSAKKLK
ncbi:MAG: hypothetical protein IPP71_16305 [Bacteroidetes bacterium]|nr:hypothetical protein [Bacteroidota bacterium]